MRSSNKKFKIKWNKQARTADDHLAKEDELLKMKLAMVANVNCQQIAPSNFNLASDIVIFAIHLYYQSVGRILALSQI